MYKMRQALAILKTEYPDINANTLRFWENSGVKHPPQKTKGGHRLYSEADLDEFRLIKEFTLRGRSLKLIRDRLNLCRDRPKLRELDTKMTLAHIRFMRVLCLEIQKFNSLSLEDKMRPIYSKEVLIALPFDEDAANVLEQAEKAGLFRIAKKGVKKTPYTQNHRIMLTILLAMPERREFVLEHIANVLFFMEELAGIGFLDEDMDVLLDENYLWRAFFNAYYREHEEKFYWGAGGTRNMTNTGK